MSDVTSTPVPAAESESALDYSTFEPEAEPESASEPDLGQGQVQARMDQETSQGFLGSEVDPTPNEHYTFSGVAAGLPTPETDRDHAASVAAELRNRD